MTVSSRTEGNRPARRAVPWSLRRRLSLLYGAKRRRILEEPIAALQRAAEAVEVDPEWRWARAQFADGSEVEAGFRGKARVFGVLIDTIWTGRRGTCGEERTEIRFRFGKNVFRSRRPDGAAVADLLTQDEEIQALIQAAELRSVRVIECPMGRLVEVIPLPGTITALYLPPLPPFTVTIRPNEADAQLALVRRLLRTAAEN